MWSGAEIQDLSYKGKTDERGGSALRTPDPGRPNDEAFPWGTEKYYTTWGNSSAPQTASLPLQDPTPSDFPSV